MKDMRRKKGFRYLSLCLAVSLLAALLPVVAWAEQSGSNVTAAEQTELTNGGFEQVENGKPASWVGWGTSSVYESVYSPVHDGSYSVKLTDASTNGGNGLRSGPVSVIPGHVYKGSVHAYNEKGNSQMYLEFWNAANERIGVQFVTASSLNQWQLLEFTGEAPQGSAYSTLMLYQHQSNVGTAYFDDAAIIELPNLFPYNGGFEEVTGDKPVGWTSLGSGFVYNTSSSQVLEGTYSVKMEDPNANVGPGLRSGQIPVVPDNLYKASVQSFNESGSSQLYLEFWNSSNVRIDVKIATNSSKGEWNPISIESYAPAGATYATLLLYQTKGNAGTAYFDLAAFSLVPPEPVRDFPLLANSHPRLYFKAEDLPDLRARAADAVNAPFGTTGKELWESVQRNADAYMTETEFSLSYYGGKIVTYPLPPVQPGPIERPPGFNSAYPYWTAMTKAVQDRLEALSLAYAVTGNDTYADKAKQYLLSVAGWNAWTDPSYPCGGFTCLDTAHLTFGVSMAVDILYDKLSVEERTTVLYALENKGVRPLYKDARSKIDHNIQTLRAAALGSGAAVLHGHSSNANAYLTRAMNYYQWYLDERMTSGKQEGMLYTSYAMDNMIKAFDHIDRVTGVRELANHPFINDFLVRWAVYNLAPGGGGLANFSDASVANYFGLTMNVINAWLDNGMAGWYLKETESAAGGINGFLYFRPNAAVSSPDQWPTSSVFDENGWASLRSGWTNDDVLFSMVSNNSRLGHNHYDQNSFQIATNRSWIAGDPGYQDYVAGPVHDFTVRMGHSTIQVDGKGQSSLGGGSLTKGLLTPTYDYIKGSAADAYGNPKLTRFDRHVVYMKPGYLVMMDDLRASTPHEYDWVMYSGGLETFEIDGEAAQAGATVGGNELYLRNGGAELAAKFLSDTELPMSVSTYPGAESYGYSTKVGSRGAKMEHQFVTVMKAKAYKPIGRFDETTLLPLTDSSGREVKVIQAAGSAVIFYRGTQAGDYMTVTVDVPEAGKYNLQSHFLHSPLYGQVQAYVDGQPAGGVYDGYAAEVVASQSFDHGYVQLTAGQHTIRYEITGKNPNSGNYFIGLDAIQLLPEGATDPEASKITVDAELIQGTGAIGADVHRNDDMDTRDLVVFRTGSESYQIAGLESDAEQAVVSKDGNGQTVGFKMTRGKSLRADGAVLLEGNAAFSASFDKDSIKMETYGVVELSAAGSIRIKAPAGAFVSVDGKLISSDGVTFDQASGTVLIQLDAGRHQVLIGSPSERTDAYAASGDLQGPLSQPLQSMMKQALDQWSKGSAEKAKHHLQQYLDHLNNPSLSEFVSSEAKAVLNELVRKLVEQLS